MVQRILNAEWVSAMPNSDADSSNIAGFINRDTGRKTRSRIKVPSILKDRWTMAARLAFFVVPKEERSAVAQVPIFCPMMIGMAAPYETCPVEASACRIPTEAELDWITAVSTAPTIIPRTGFLNRINICRNAGTSASPDTAEDMASMPNIRVAKPKRMVPVSFFLLVFPNIKRRMPTVARMGVKEVGFSILIKKLSLEMPLKLRSHAVTVVPTFAPMITLIACFKVITPGLTKPTRSEERRVGKECGS